MSVRFGDPLRALPDETPVAFARRAQVAVARLLDEDETDWWSSLRRAAPAQEDATPKGSWRRTWASTRPVAPPPVTGPQVWRR